MRFSRRSFLICAISCLVCLLPSALSAKDAASTSAISARAEANKANVTIGEPITLKIAVRHKKNIQILNSLSDPEMLGLDVKDSKDWTDQEGQFEIIGRTITVTSFQLGNYVVDPIEIAYQVDNQPAQTIKTNPVYITVKSVAEGEEKSDIRDVKGVVKLPYLLTKYATPVGITAFLTLLFVLFLLYRRKYGIKNESAQIERRSPAEEAIRDLHELFDSSLIRDGKVKSYYLRFSEILKVFLEKQFGIQAAEATTSEIAALMKRVDFDTAPKQQLIEILQATDFAKFAKWVPAPADIINLNNQAEAVVIALSAKQDKQPGETHAIS